MFNQGLALQLLKIITQTTIHTRHGIFPITPHPIDKIWNMFNLIANAEGITMLDQINVFERFILDYKNV